MSEHRQPVPITFGADGLIPVVTQDADSDAVLMIGFMTAEALELTQTTGEVHYWSRSRQEVWHKGETSGHRQLVQQIRVNCEQNSLLLIVIQIGAVCHMGYGSCFYRRVEPDGSLEIVLERMFDPVDIYLNPLSHQLSEWYGAYEYLRDTALIADSRTSQFLHDASVPLHRRVAEELREMAGVLRGTHVHTAPEDDLRLEASQALYWLALIAIRDRIPFATLRPDVAMTTGDAALPPATIASLIEAEAAVWEVAPAKPELSPHIHAALAIVAQGVVSGDVQLQSVIAADLAALAAKPYMTPYFAQFNGGSGD